MEQFQEKLSNIREKEYERIKDNEFYQWQMVYQDYLSDLYDIFCRYYTVDYKTFVNIAYDTRLK